MKENKLVKRGWWKAMIHQRTISLILTLDNFLVSGPHILFDSKNRETVFDPNVFFVKNRVTQSLIPSELDKEENQNSLTNTQTYYVMRSFIRGILFGLNPLYQISLFVPCSDTKQIQLYKEIISKIDIGGQFFQDRIYWNSESLQRDIMDEKLACLIYAENSSIIKNDWIKKISLEIKPFNATIDSDLTMNNNLFELVEMRSFLEEMHQRFFSLVSESKSTHFTNMIRFYITDNNNNNNNNKRKENLFNLNGFYSVYNGVENRKNSVKCYDADRYSLKENETTKSRNGFNFFKTIENLVDPLKPLTDEYEKILLDQLEINNQMSRNDIQNEEFKNCLTKWNSITLRKSEILRTLLNQSETKTVCEKLRHFNAIYYQKKYQDCIPESDIYHSSKSQQSSQSEASDNSYNMAGSDNLEINGKETKNFNNGLFSTWYVKLENS